MTEVAALGLKVSTDGVTQATSDLKKLTGAAIEAEQAAEKLAPAEKKAGAAAGEMGDKALKAATDTKKLGDDSRTTEGALHRLAMRAGTVVGSLVAMATAAVSVGAYVRLADSWSDLRSQLGAATGDMEGASGMMMRMLEIAQASYSPLDQTVQTYARNVAVLRDLGKSADEAANFTESLNHMLVITATKGERAASVQDALSKAMATGKLQADGLETVLANGGRVAQALAAELGTTVSGLRDFASQGKITGQVIADAVIKPLSEVREAAGGMDATIADGFTKVGNSLLALVGNFDQATGASIWFATKLDDLSKWLTALSQTDFAAWADSATSALTLLGQAVLVLAATRIPALIAAIASMNASAALMVAGFVAMRVQALAAAVASRTLGVALAAAGGPLGLLAAGAIALGVALFNGTQRAREYAEAAAATAAAQATLNSALDEFYRMDTKDAWKRAQEEAQNAVDTITRQLEIAQRRMDGTSFMTNVFGYSLSQGAGVDFLASEVERLQGELLEAQSILSAMDHAAGRFKDTVAVAADGVAKLTAEQEKAVASAQELERSYRDRAELARVQVQYGQDSAQYLEAQLNQERAIQHAKINALDISERQKESARQAYDLMVKQEAAAKGWNVQIGVVNGSLSSSYQALVKIRDTQPGASWLDVAIQKAADLALKLWDAVGANSALSVSARPGMTTGNSEWAKNDLGFTLPGSELIYKAPKSTGGGGSSSADDMKDRFKALSESFASEYQLSMQHYARDRETLKWALDNKKILIAEYNDNLEMLRISAWGADWEQSALQYELDQQALQAALDHKLLSEEEYYRKRKEMQWANALSEDNRSDLATDLGNWSSYFGDLNSLAGGGFDGLLKAQKAYAAGSALVNAWLGYSQTMADPTLSFWMKFAAAGKVLAAGIGAVSAIKGASSSAAGSATRSASGGSSASAASVSKPQDVIIDLQSSDAAVKALAQALLDPMIKQLQKASKTGVNIVGVRY